MFIAHLPAGYLVARCCYVMPGGRKAALAPFLLAGMAGAVAPDADLIYFFLSDRQQHHHLYVTHWPSAWLVLLLAGLLWLASGWQRSKAELALIFSLNGLVHLCLDTIASEVWWLAPFSERSWSLITVPARFSPWWVNFILHPTFLLEVLIAGLACWHLANRAAPFRAGQPGAR